MEAHGGAPMSKIMNRSIPETLKEVDSLVTSIANEIEIFNRCLTPIWGISGTSGSVIFGQKILSYFCGFDDVIPDQTFLVS